MATSIEGSAGNDLVIPDSAADDIVIEASDDLATVEVKSSVSDINLEVGGEKPVKVEGSTVKNSCLLYTSPSPRD